MCPERRECILKEENISVEVIRKRGKLKEQNASVEVIKRGKRED